MTLIERDGNVSDDVAVDVDVETVIDLRADDVAIVEAGSMASPVGFVDLAGEYQRNRAAIDAAIAGVLERGDFVLGRAVSQLEADFANFCDVDFGIGVDSGFSALELILRGLGVGPGDEVITVANTFIATLNAIDVAGARPVLVDMDPVTYNIDPNQVEAAITPATSAIIAVHLYGQPADMDSLRAIADRHGLALIEDACQAHGARLGGRRAGSLADAAAFSFYPSKNLGAFGDGGMIVTNDSALASQVKLLRNLGSSVKYEHSIIGYNRRLDTLQAAVLGVKLGVLDEANASRRQSARLYEKLLDGLPLGLPKNRDDAEPVYHLYVIQADARDELSDHLRAEEVATGIHYPIPVHLQPAYEKLGYQRGAFPATEAAAGRILSLPMYPDMTIESLGKVVRGIQSFFEGAG